MDEGRDSVVTLEPEEDKNTTIVKFISDDVLNMKDALEKMVQNTEFYQGKTDKEYTVEGSIIGCNYGYNLTKIGIVKDHAIYDNNGNAVLTCGDCEKNENVYNFGLCGSPMLNKNSEKTTIGRGAPYAAGETIMGYKCKLQLVPGWQTGKVHTYIWNTDKNNYEAVLPKDGVLTCVYGAGTISIKENNKTKNNVTELVLYTTQSVNLRNAAGGSLIVSLLDNEILIVDNNSWTTPQKIKDVSGAEQEWIKVRFFNNLNEKDPGNWTWIDGWVVKVFTKEVSTKNPGKNDIYANNNKLRPSEMLTNARYIYTYYINHKEKWEKNAIYGLLGNLETESRINPKYWEKGVANPGFGLVQWTPSSKLTKWAKSEGLDPNDINCQLERLVYEKDNNEQWQAYRHSANMSFEDFTKSTEAPEKLAEIFLYCYEQPKQKPQIARGKQAERWCDVLELLNK